MNKENYKKYLSIIIPAFNEAKNLEILIPEIVSVLKNKNINNWEIILTNDGSSDNTINTVNKLGNLIKAINFPEHLGKAQMLMAGFKKAEGEIIITLDADLQDDPAEIQRFIKKINEGYDLVSGRKFHRLDSLIKNNTSKIYNLATSLISGVWLHDHNCGFKAYKAPVVENLRLFGQLHRYIPVLAAANGFEKITEININHRKRVFGKTKYNWTRFFWGIIGLIHVIIITNGKAVYFIRKIKKLFQQYGNYFKII